MLVVGAPTAIGWAILFAFAVLLAFAAWKIVGVMARSPSRHPRPLVIAVVWGVMLLLAIMVVAFPATPEPTTEKAAERVAKGLWIDIGVAGVVITAAYVALSLLINALRRDRDR